MTPEERADRVRGVLLLLAAAALFSLMAVSVKVATAALSPAVVVLARGLLMTLMTGGLLWLRGEDPRGNRRGLLLVRGLVGSVGLLSFFYAVSTLRLADVTTLFALNPLFTAVFAAVFLGERVRPALVVTLALSAFGVALVSRPFAGDVPLVPVLVTLLGSAFAGLAYTTIRALRTSDSPLVIVFYFAVCSIGSALPFLPWEALRWPTPLEGLALLGVAGFTQLAQLAMTRGLALVPAGPATAVSYTQIVFATTWGVLFFAEIPPWTTFLGALLIVAGLVVNLWSQTRARPTFAPAPPRTP